MDIMSYKNKEDQKVYFKKWYAKNKKKFNKQVYEITKRRRKELRAWLNEYKSKRGCETEGCEETHPACLEFHHKEKNKEKGVSEMCKNAYGKKRILKEIKKCSLLCANCHRKKHFPVKENQVM